MPRPHPEGHFIGMVGVYLVVPFPANRSAFTTVDAAGAATTTQFANQMEAAPRFSLGYVFHNGWGVRASYWFLHGDTTATGFNIDPTITLATPTALPFRIMSPSATLQTGIGADQFTATRSIQLDVGDVEVVKEACCFGMTFLGGMGVRYGRIAQGYSATRTNPGGAGTDGLGNPVIVGFDREDLHNLSRYEGLGPTLSLDSVCPIYRGCLAMYSNVRGSALFGVERFYQDQSLQTNSVVAGVPTNTSTFISNRTTDVRTAYNVELEAGLQFGKRIGPVYVFSRAGVVAQRWWNVGNPLGTTGSLNFLGGTFQVGLAY